MYVQLSRLWTASRPCVVTQHILAYTSLTSCAGVTRSVSITPHNLTTCISHWHMVVSGLMPIPDAPFCGSGMYFAPSPVLWLCKHNWLDDRHAIIKLTCHSCCSMGITCTCTCIVRHMGELSLADGRNSWASPYENLCMCPNKGRPGNDSCEVPCPAHVLGEALGMED